MIEILWLGRGGQGAFTAAKLLGAAFTEKGDDYHSLSFPSFGPERRGAPIKAFTKLDNKPILNRSETEKADYIVILDESLYSEDLHNHLKGDGKIFVNSNSISGENIYPFDGNSVAKSFKLPTANTVMLGVISAVTKVVSSDDLLKAISEYMPEKIQGMNKLAIVRIAKEVLE